MPSCRERARVLKCSVHSYLARAAHNPVQGRTLANAFCKSQNIMNSGLLCFLHLSCRSREKKSCQSFHGMVGNHAGTFIQFLQRLLQVRQSGCGRRFPRQHSGARSHGNCHRPFGYPFSRWLQLERSWDPLEPLFLPICAGRVRRASCLQQVLHVCRAHVGCCLILGLSMPSLVSGLLGTHQGKRYGNPRSCRLWRTPRRRSLGSRQC